MGHVRRFDMPSTQIELDDRDESLNWIVNRGHGQERFGVCHEATEWDLSARRSLGATFFLLEMERTS